MPLTIQQIIPCGLQISMVQSHESSFLTSQLVSANTYTKSSLKLVSLCNYRSSLWLLWQRCLILSWPVPIGPPPSLACLRRQSYSNVHSLPTSYPYSPQARKTLCFRTSSLSISLVSSKAVRAQAEAWPHFWTWPSLFWNPWVCVSNLVQHK